MLKPVVACIVTAGICPKPAHTFGEPHYCLQDDWRHEGLHTCRQCGMAFNANSVSGWLKDPTNFLNKR